MSGTAVRWLVAPLLVLGAIAAGCNTDDGGGGLRTFDLDVLPYDPDNPLEAAALSEEWAQVEVKIVAAPDVVTAGGDDFPLVLEMHNPLDEAISLRPCPVWEAGMGESSEVSNVEGRLPCDDIGSLRPGERIRLRMDMPPTDHAVEDQQGDGLVGLGWRLKGEFFQETAASARFAMDGPE
ncbi:MAG: hypothetical protein ACO1PW_04500 [Actinomycetota bacterium]